MRFDHSGFYKNLAVAASSRCLFNEGESLAFRFNCAKHWLWVCPLPLSAYFLAFKSHEGAANVLTVAWSMCQVAWEKGVVVGGNRGGMSVNRH